jgi:hypothetical protein
MPQFLVRARERVLVETEYRVRAGSSEQAVILCQTGQLVPETEKVEDDKEWVDTLSVEQIKN